MFRPIGETNGLHQSRPWRSGCRGRPPRPPSAESHGSRRPPRLPTLGRSRWRSGESVRKQLELSMGKTWHNHGGILLNSSFDAKNH